MRGNTLSTLILFFGGVLCLIAAVYIYSSSETNSYAQVRSNLKELQNDALTKTDLYAALEAQKLGILDSMNLRCSAIVDEKLKPVQLNFDEAIRKAEAVKKEQDFMKVQMHTLDKRLASQPKHIKFEINRPVPVEFVTPAPPPLKKKPLLKRAGVIP